MDIVPLVDAPAILPSDWYELTAHVISEVKDFWPALVMVHGKLHHAVRDLLNDQNNGDIKDMLVAWFAANDTHDWVTGIKFVQF